MATVLAPRFFKGRLMLVTRKQVEDHTFWAEHDIALAVSFNGGCFQREGNEQNQGWFQYPLGRKALNIPLSSKRRCVERTRSCLPHIVGTWACSRNVAMHCLNTVHRGPVGMGMLAMILCPHSIDEAVAKTIMQRIKSKWPRMANAVLQSKRPYEYRDAMLWDRFHELVKEVIPRIRVTEGMLREGSVAFTGGWSAPQITHGEVMRRIIETPHQRSKLEQLELLLTESQRGIQEGLPVAELQETWAEWQRDYGPHASEEAAHKKGKGKEKGKAKGKVAETKGGQGGKGKEKGKVADGKGGKDGKGKEKSQVADSKGEGGKGSKTSGIQADATINAMFRTCHESLTFTFPTRSGYFSELVSESGAARATARSQRNGIHHFQINVCAEHCWYLPSGWGGGGKGRRATTIRQKTNRKNRIQTRKVEVFSGRADAVCDPLRCRSGRPGARNARFRDASIRLELFWYASRSGTLNL